MDCIVDGLIDLSAIEVDQDGRRALGITLPPVFQGVPTERVINPWTEAVVPKKPKALIQ
jgi:hypothetical protein